jgi:ATP-binding cassette subfamily C (CFTR/MRP) protein 2
MKVERDSVGLVTPFAKAGFLGRMSFWWLNPLMKIGRKKTLEDEDIPKLREADRAENCYMLFLEQLNKKKGAKPSILKAIILCHWKEIILTGCFALFKILTVSAGPLLLNSFILVGEGKKSFKYEGHLLAISFFFLKSIESISQRQWFFRSRLIGLKVRSLLIAAIYKKQLRLTNSARLKHSGGQIMNYVTVDAYRIGELPFWFHESWTTGLQLCLALAILVHAVGLATIAALAVIILTVLCNIPIGKIQHKFQSKLMVAQDERLKTSSEALVNMKVLKLYAWETHFKNVIENLRKVEHKRLSAVQSERAYHYILFWSTPVLVSSATFVACYFLRIPLHANNVFTFVATFRLVQESISHIPDVFGVFIKTKIAFARIVQFLEAPELQSAHVQHDCNMESVNHSIFIKSAKFSWEENSSEPTLRSINLEVRPGEKVAICGEVGSGKSTLLAAILGEVPKIQGTVSSFCSFTFFL